MNRRIVSAAAFLLCLVESSGRAAAFPQSDLEEVVSRAQQSQSTGDFEAAAEQYQAALKLNSNIPELWANLGFMENQLKKYDDAIADFRHALQLKPGMFAPNLFIGLDYLEESQPKAALPFLKKAEALNATDEQALLALGRAYRAVKDYPAATQAYARARVLAPADSKAYFGLGMAYLEDVEASSRKLVDTAPESSYAQALLAGSYLEEGEIAQAGQLVQELSKTDPAFLQEHFELLAETLTQDQLEIFKTSAPAIAPLLARPKAAQGHSESETAQQLYASGRYGECMQRLQSAQRRLSPSDINLLAACAYRAGNYAAAFDVSTSGHPDPGELYWRIKSSQKLAAAALARAAAIAPDSPATSVLLGDIARQQQQYDTALTYYQKALKLAPGDPAALLGSTAAYMMLSKPEQATAAAQQFLSAHPDDPEMNLLLAEAFSARHDYASAESALARSATVKPELRARMHALLGKVYAETGRPQQAIIEFKLGLASDEDGSVYYQLARLYRLAGDKAAADSALATSRQLSDQRRKRAFVAITAGVPSPASLAQ